MAKSNFPVMKSGSGLLGKAIGLVVGLAIIVLIVKYPADSASWVSGAIRGVGAVIDGVVKFLRALFG
ncbi:hypothetical protein DMA12_47465 [Amycolatopsis balhimycina DSM 5908]|uniref:Uncharacterized protein n=1 Tax=Amycolatopsis balhimycina DSM 5908 TaxID=1081091 RepID=A0A428VV05_AMYBA|nr:hypothetical protein [Amycolatopsis balhimycina]RSM34660.1 hypothetical protein DMA12_47465 [Amycolatopsis balhimycina DSM 5908]